MNGKNLIIKAYNSALLSVKNPSELLSLAYLTILQDFEIDMDDYGDITYFSFKFDYPLSYLHDDHVSILGDFINNAVLKAIKYVYAYLTNDTPDNVVTAFDTNILQVNTNKGLEQYLYDKLIVRVIAYSKSERLRYDVIRTMLMALYLRKLLEEMVELSEKIGVSLEEKRKIMPEAMRKLLEKKRQLLDDLEFKHSFLIKKWLLDYIELKNISDIKQRLKDWLRWKLKKRYSNLRDNDIDIKVHQIIDKLDNDRIKKHAIKNGLIVGKDINADKLDSDPFISKLKQYCIKRGWIDRNYNLLKYNVKWLESKLFELVAKAKYCVICGSVFFNSKEGVITCNNCRMSRKRKKKMLIKYFDYLKGEWLKSKDEIIADMKRRSEATGSKDTVRDWNTLISSLMKTIEREWEQDKG